MFQLLRILIAFLILSQTCFAAVSNLKEEDGSPDIYPWQLRVPNGTLIDNGDGTASFSISSGSGDVVGPATNTDGYIPQWNGANSKTLKNGIPTSTFATSAQGTLADTALQSVPDLSATYLPLHSKADTAGAADTVTGLSVTAGQTLTVTTGGTLGSAAYTASTDYATATQGGKADSALQSVTAHNLLSTTHGDTAAGSVVRGDILYGNATPKWDRLAFPATPTGKVIQATATDIGWSSCALGTAAFTASTAYDASGAAAAVTPTTLSLVIGTNTQAHGAKLDAIQTLASAAGWLHNDGAGAFAYSTPSYSDVGALASGGTAADSSKLGGSLPAAYALTGQTMYLGTTSVAINRGTGALSLAGVSIDGTAGSATGNAGTATKLAATKTIGRVAFDGSGDIVPQTIQSINEATDTTCYPLFISAAGTQSLQPLNNSGLIYNSNANSLTATIFVGALTGTASGNLVSGGALGTPSSGTLTSCTGLPVAGITASTSTALGVGSIELGHATDTTITRSGAGVIAVESVVIPSISSTNTLTNKRHTPRIYTTASIAGTPGVLTPEIDTYDYFELTAQAAALNIANHSTSTPTGGEKMIIAITSDATPRALTYGTNYVAYGGVALPTTTVASKTTTLGFIWNAGLTKWNLVAVAQQA